MLIRLLIGDNVIASQRARRIALIRQLIGVPSIASIRQSIVLIGLLIGDNVIASQTARRIALVIDSKLPGNARDGPQVGTRSVLFE